MIKGASIAIICLVLGGIIGNRTTLWELDRNTEMYFKGQEAAKKK